jgi:hypothetical protein
MLLLDQSKRWGLMWRPLTFLPPIYASINALTAVFFLVSAVGNQ